MVTEFDQFIVRYQDLIRESPSAWSPTYSLQFLEQYMNRSLYTTFTSSATTTMFIPSVFDKDEEEDIFDSVRW